MRTEKQCCACRKTLPIGEFHSTIRRKKLSGGHIGSLLVYAARCHRCRRMYFQCRRYGLTDKQYAVLTQDPRCQICGSTGEDTQRGLHIDHCHRTNKIRGLLCMRCNRIVGYLDDAMGDKSSRLIEYLKNNLNLTPEAPIRATFDIRKQRS